MNNSTEREPFDRAARRAARSRAAAGFSDFAYLKDDMAADLAARAAGFERRWRRVLDLGAHDGRAGRLIPAETLVEADSALAFARGCSEDRGLAVVCDEDRLPFADSAFDLILSAGSLQGVNDLPGALIQARRALRPGGLFLAAFVGGASLHELRHALIEAELLSDKGVAPRMLPMVDAREAPGLLQRAGFINPVVDVAAVMLRFRDPRALLRDVRGMGEGNILAERSRTPLMRAARERMVDAVEILRDGEGRIVLSLELITLTGHAAG